MTELGGLVRRMRGMRGLTQVQLADLIGKSQHYISDIETGEIGLPGNEVLTRLAEALDMPRRDIAEAAGLVYREIIEVRRLDAPYLVRVIGRIPADTIRLALLEEEGDDVRTVEATPSELNGVRSPFALEASGDCMQAFDIRDGDIVIFDHDETRTPRDGERVAVRINGDGVTFKRWCVVGTSVELRDGDGNIVARLADGDTVDVLGFYVTFKPIAPR